MNDEKVKELFFLISGEKAEQEEERLHLCEQLCQSAYREVQNAVKENLPQEIYRNYQPALEELAAAKAFYHLLLLDESKQADLIEDPHLKIILGEKSAKAENFYWVCKRKVAVILKDNTFFFGTTECGEKDE